MKDDWYYKAKAPLEEKLIALYNEKDLSREGRYQEYREITLALNKIQSWWKMCNT